MLIGLVGAIIGAVTVVLFALSGAAGQLSGFRGP